MLQIKCLKKFSSLRKIISMISLPVLFGIPLMFLFSGCQNKSKYDDGSGAYHTGQYRNLFLENGHSQEEITAKVNDAFQQLFYGDTSQRLYFQAGENDNGPLAYLKDVYNNDIRSEGMSYGMMICVQLNKKDEFDALWNWTMTNMYISSPDHPTEGYFAWSVNPDGSANSETPAPDGEEYFIMSLYFAANQWGNGNGIYNYKAYADTILTTMRHHPVKSGNTKFGPKTIGPMVSENAHMILFVPDSGRNTITDPSYHLPAFYELWSRWGPEPDREFWAIAANTSRSFFKKACNPETGLCSDYTTFDGAPYTSKWHPFSGYFFYDSWRTASNWSVDWSWWGKDTGEVVLSNRIQSFFAGEGMDSYGSLFTVNGDEVYNSHRIGLISTNAVASLAASHPLAKDFVEAFWDAPVPDKFDQRYYDGTLYMLSLLHCSGEFKIIKPELQNK